LSHSGQRRPTSRVATAAAQAQRSRCLPSRNMAWHLLPWSLLP
jgi:hypothetical protein